ncbi:MAG: hypothetical protein GY940_22130, partial [bacterium]|nr:hypothetical protein [bacterium]
KEIPYWAQMEAADIPAVPVDFAVPANDKNEPAKISFYLTPEETEALITTVNEAFFTEINDILLTALGLAFKESFGMERLLVAMEGHGRETILEDVDITRTIGWFTSIYPVLLDFSYASVKADETRLSRQIKEIKESLRLVPARGIGYGILKYLTHPGHKTGLSFGLKPQVRFNYLGQFDADLEQRSFSMAKESMGPVVAPGGEREYLLEVSGLIAGKRLVLSIGYHPRQFKPGTPDTLLANFKTALIGIISHCTTRKTRQLTPSDFTYTGLTIPQVDQLMR